MTNNDLGENEHMVNRVSLIFFPEINFLFKPLKKDLWKWKLWKRQISHDFLYISNFK